MNLKTFYSKTYNFVYLRAKSILEKEEDIKQLMKDVYLQANAKNIDESHMYEWLGKKTYSLACEKYRRKKVREAELIEWDKQTYAAASPIISEDAKEVICESLEELPDMYFGTFYAFYYDHMKIKDVSGVMGYSVEAIINRLNYTHKYLERAIADYCEENKVTVQISVGAVCEALREWCEINQLSETVAQNIYASICRELGVRTDNIDEEEDGGLTARIVKCAENEVDVICSELESYSLKKRLDPKQLVIFAGAGVLVLLLVLCITLIGGLEKKKKTEKIETTVEQQDNEEEITDDSSTIPSNDEEENTTDEVDKSEYILPDSNTKKLTRADLEGLTKEELRLARNEIYARYGIIFGAEDLKEYFGSKSWYEPKIPYDDFYDEVEIGDIEAANVNLIVELEDEMD